VLGGLERRPVAADLVTGHRPPPPAGQQQVAPVPGRQARFVVVRLPHRDTTAHVRDHRLQQIGTLGCLPGHPPARPAEVGSGSHVQQAAGHVVQRQALVVVVVSEQVPAQATTVAGATSHHLQVAAVGEAPQHAADPRVGHPRPLGLTEKRPVSPVVGSAEVAVKDQHVTQRQVEVSVGSPGQAVKTLVWMIVGVAPDQSFGLDPGSLRDRSLQQVQRPVGHRVQVVATDLEVIDPRVGREPEDLAPLPQPAGSPTGIRLVDEHRLAATDKQPPGGIGPHRQERLARRTVDGDDLECRVPQPVFLTGGQHRRGECAESQADRHLAGESDTGPQQRHGSVSTGVSGDAANGSPPVNPWHAATGTVLKTGRRC